LRRRHGVHHQADTHLVPCPRVIRADGGIGGYLGGIEAKAALLTLDRAT
jgi:O6-methylguanine-DNA--protein-cysteine methyltransferase